MQTSILEPTGDTKSRKLKTQGTLSADGKWRSFKQVPNLQQYVPNDNYFARVKVGGKIIRKSLGTETFTTAKLLLLDFLKAQKTKRHPTGAPVTFKEAEEIYKTETQADYTLSDASKKYRLNCLKKISETWPQLREKQLTNISETECQEWAAKIIASEIDDQYFNNLLGTLRAVLKIGLRLHVKRGGSPLENPAKEIKRLGVKRKSLVLPEQDQFFKLLAQMESVKGNRSQHCADLVRFLAFSGCRISEAKKVLWRHVDLEKGFLTVQGAKNRRTSDESPTRLVPIIAPMRDLLERLRTMQSELDKPVCRVHECEKSMTAACTKLGITRITHHDLRHLFATRCIESSVDIQTVSRWLGHRDGGALAMKVYGHLRHEHSAAMAQRVTFNQPK